ncbi:MAG: glycosyltransferase family 1 protein [Cyanobacteria bacterium J06621_8]
MSNPLLINLAVLFDKPTGIATYAQNIISSLDSLQPVLLTAQAFPGFEQYAIADNMTPAQGTKGHIRRLWWTQFQLPQIYRQLKADLIYSPIPEAPLYSPARFVVMAHDIIPLRFPRWNSPLTNYFRYVVPQVLNQAEHIICNSQATARDLREYYKIPGSKITPILLGYDSAHFYPRPQTTDNNPPYFLYLGRQDPYKNLTGLINAFANLPTQDYHLAIAGSTDPRYTPQLQQQAADLGITDRIKWIDYLNYQDLPGVISNAIALVLPTFWEGFGLPVLEAMACGTPVITSDLASLPEITGDAAILINPKDTAAINSAMIDIAQDSALRSQLSQLGIQRAQQFSWSKTGMATREVLQKFI